MQVDAVWKSKDKKGKDKKGKDKQSKCKNNGNKHKSTSQNIKRKFLYCDQVGHMKENLPEAELGCGLCTERRMSLR